MVLVVHDWGSALGFDWARELCRTWPNQREVTVPGSHFIQEDSPDAIDAALAEFVREIRR